MSAPTSDVLRALDAAYLAARTLAEDARDEQSRAAAEAEAARERYRAAARVADDTGIVLLRARKARREAYAAAGRPVGIL